MNTLLIYFHMCILKYISSIFFCHSYENKITCVLQYTHKDVHCKWWSEKLGVFVCTPLEDSIYMNIELFQLPREWPFSKCGPGVPKVS